MNESTNCESKSPIEFGEHEIAESFDQILQRAKGRVIFSAFSSQIHRIQSILTMAKKNDSNVDFAGYSMIENLEVALGAGVIKVHKDKRKRMDYMFRLENNKIIDVGTSSQGELNPVNQFQQL